MKRKKVRNPKPIRPEQAPGPVTNKRVANKPIKPARGRFVERVQVDDPGPEDVTHFDARPRYYMDDVLGAIAVCELARFSTPPLELQLGDVLQDLQAAIDRDGL